jgi:hypothetical protein
MEQAVNGFARAGLSPADKREITASIYAAQSRSRSELFAWELAWWERVLPKRSSRILVGGCGRGVEVRALIERGHEVWAFDPALDCIRECQRDNPRAAFVGCFGYEDLSAAGLLDEQVVFDAIVMGWGSLSHVLEEDDQLRVLRQLASLAPRGPILASFLADPSARTQGRAERLGRDLARWAARASSEHPRESDHVRCLAHGGFVYLFTRTRIEELARLCRRRLELHFDGNYPHATLWPD